jgi:hypothetical protein
MASPLSIWEYETHYQETYRYRADGWLGGNAIGASGQLRGELEGGAAVALDGDHHLFARGGFAGELQRNAAIGLALLELPVVGGGYQYHHSSHETPWHVEVGPRAGVAVAGVAVAGDERARLGFAPEVGGAAAVLYNGFGIELSGMHLFETEPMDVLRGSACAGLLLVLCLDHRTVIADFRNRREATHLFALSVGVGGILGEKL